MPNKLSKTFIKIFPHLIFWVGLFLLFVYQNPKSAWQDYLDNLMILATISIAIYVNLYLLLPLFFSKKYGLYFILLLTNILVVGFLLTLAVGGFGKEAKGTDFFQNTINVFFLILLTSGLKFFREYNRKQMQVKILENAKLKAELDLLKAQINPHFLFNSLNSLYGMVLENHNQQASETILKLSDLMRYILESNQKEKVSLTEEVKFIQNYLALEQIRISPEIEIRLDTSLKKEDIDIPPLLFIPLVENVFKHAINQHIDKGFAHFSLSLQHQQLFFETKNSLPLHQFDDKQSSGTGLKNLEKRLALLYPNRHNLSIEKDEAIYQVNLFIEL